MKKWWKQILAAILITASVGAVSFAISSSVEEAPEESDTSAVIQNRPPQPKSESPQVSGAVTQQPQTTPQVTQPAPQPTYTPQPQPAPAPVTNEQDQATLQRLAEEKAQQQEIVRQLKCESIVASRDADILTENSRHTNAIAAINADYRSRGLGFSGMLQAAIEGENANHQSKLNVINQKYQVELASYGC